MAKAINKLTNPTFQTLHLDCNLRSVEKLWMPSKGAFLRQVKVLFQRIFHAALHGQFITNSLLLAATKAKAQEMDRNAKQLHLIPPSDGPCPPIKETMTVNQLASLAVQVRAIAAKLLKDDKVADRKSLEYAIDEADTIRAKVSRKKRVPPQTFEEAVQSTPADDITRWTRELERSGHRKARQLLHKLKPHEYHALETALAKDDKLHLLYKRRWGIPSLPILKREALFNSMMDKAVIDARKRRRGGGFFQSPAIKYLTRGVDSYLLKAPLKQQLPDSAKKRLSILRSGLEHGRKWVGITTKNLLDPSSRFRNTNQILHAIKKLEEHPEETVILPMTSLRHATALAVRRDIDGSYSITYYNTGSGTRERHLHKGSQMLTYWGFCKLPTEAVQDKAFWSNLMKTSPFGDVDQAYQEIEEQAHLYGGLSLYEAHPPQDVEFTTGQQTGTCTFSCIWAVMRHDLCIHANSPEEGHAHYKIAKAGMQQELWELNRPKKRDKALNRAATEKIESLAGSTMLTWWTVDEKSFRQARNLLLEGLGLPIPKQPPEPKPGKPPPILGPHQQEKVPTTTEGRYQELRTLTRDLANKWLAKGKAPDEAELPPQLVPTYNIYKLRSGALARIEDELIRISTSKRPEKKKAEAMGKVMRTYAYNLSKYKAGSLPMLVRVIEQAKPEKLQKKLIQEFSASTSVAFMASFLQHLEKTDPGKLESWFGINKPSHPGELSQKIQDAIKQRDRSRFIPLLACAKNHYCLTSVYKAIDLRYKKDFAINLRNFDKALVLEWVEKGDSSYEVIFDPPTSKNQYNVCAFLKRAVKNKDAPMIEYIVKHWQKYDVSEEETKELRKWLGVNGRLDLDSCIGISRKNDTFIN